MEKNNLLYNPQHLEYQYLFDKALNAATSAIAQELGLRPENPNAFDCGFAWVTIPANNGFARWCKAQRALHNDPKFGGTGYPSGWQFWCPGDWSGQSVRVWRAGAAAFAEQLQLAGLSAVMSSRLD